MNVTKINFILFFLIFNQLTNGQTESDRNKYDQTHFNLALSFSPRYCNTIISDILSERELKNLNGYTFVNYNFNIFYQIKKKEIFISTGLSMLKYGWKESNVLSYVGTVYPGISVYDSVSVKSIGYYIGIPIGVGKIIYTNKKTIIVEAGILNNMFIYGKTVPFNAKDKNIVGGIGIPIRDPFFSAYIKFGFILNINNIGIIIQPVFNSTFYNLALNSGAGSFYMYQVGIDSGIIFRL